MCQMFDNQEKSGERIDEEKLKKELAEDTNVCKMNRFNSYDCSLCKVIVPSMARYEEHA